MERQRGELGPIAEALAELTGPVQALRKTPPPARRGFTVADQVDRLVAASEADPDRVSWRGCWSCAPCRAATPATAFSTSAPTGRSRST